MRTPKQFFLQFCIILVALMVISGPAWSEGPTASPSSVAFSYVVITGERHVEQDVTINGATVDTVTCTNPTTPVPQNLLSGTKTGDHTVKLMANVNLSPLSSYSGSCTVTFTGVGSVVIPVTFTVNGSTSSALTVSPATLTFNSATAGGIPYPPTSTLTLTSSLPVSYTASSNAPWLTVYPTSGRTDTNPTLTVQVSQLPTAATYTGTITITPVSGPAQTVTVNYGVGVSSGGLFVSPSTMTFAYSTGGATPAAQSLYVSSSNASATQVTFYPYNCSWVRVDGATSATKPLVGGTTATTTNITVDPTDPTLASGTTNTCSMTVSDGYSAAQVVTVYFNVNSSGTTGILSASPTLVNFSYYPGAASYPSQQTVFINGVGSSFSFTSSIATWLSVTQSGSTLLLNVNPSGLSTGTYYANIMVTSTALTPAQTINIPVTFSVGTSAVTGTVAAPSSLSFAMQKGAGGSATQYIAVAGNYGASFSATSSMTSGTNWLTISGAYGTTPGVIMVQATPGTDMASGTYNGSVTVTSTYGTLMIPVSLTVSDAPVLTFTSSGDVVASYLAGGTAPGVQQINLGISGGTTQFTYTASTATSWLSVTPPAGTTPQQMSIVINPSGLSTGLNVGSVTISTPNAANSTTTFPVVLNVYSTAALRLSTNALAFNTTQGTSPAAQNFTITTDASTPYTATAASSTAGWLSVTPATGTAPGSVTVNVTSAGMAAGQYTGTITVSAAGQTQNIAVTLNVGGAVGGTLSTTPRTLTFDHLQGDSAPPVQQIGVTSSGSSLTYTVTTATSAGSGWLSVNKSGGQTPGDVNVSVNPTALSPGTYNGTVTIASAGASGSPQVTNVVLTVRAAPNLVVATNTAQFTYRTDSSVPPGQSVRVTSSAADISFSASSSDSWLTVSPASGITPADITIGVNPTGLSANRYEGTITISGTDTRSTQTIGVVLTVAVPLPTITRVVHAATGAEGPMAAGQVFTVIGENLGPATKTDFQVDDTDHYMKTLANTKIRVNGIPAPLVYVSASEARAIAPYRLADAKEANVQVEYQGSRSNTVTMDAVDAAPGIFTVDGSGSGAASVVNQDGSTNSASNPAERGSSITIIFTGAGQTDPEGEDGMINRAEQSSSPKPILPVTVAIDGMPATTIWAGALQGQVAGMTQVKLQVPFGSRPGVVPLQIQMGKFQSPSNVTIAVK